MKIEQLHYFVETINYKSINKAAEGLFISQSTLSESLQKLEKELDVKLLERTRMGVVPTSEGKQLYIIANEIIEKINDFKKMITNSKQNQFKENRLAYFITPEMAEEAALNLMEYMSNNYPKTQLACKVGDFLDGYYSVIDEDVEFAIMLLYEKLLEHPEIKKLSTENNLAVKELARSPVMVTVNKDSPLAKAKEVSIKEVLKYPAVIYKTDLDPTWHKYVFSEYGDLNVEFCSGNWEMSDGYTRIRKDIIGFTSRNSLLKFNINKQIPLKEEINFVTILVYRKKDIDDNLLKILNSIINNV